MRLFLLLSLVIIANECALAQQKGDCDQLSIAFRGIVAGEENDQLFFEVSNALYTGTLYNYPGFLLLDEKGDPIAQEETRYYGIGTNFQTHLLEITGDLSFPFSGSLELYGSFYQNFFCRFPIDIASAELVEPKTFEEAEVKVETNFAGDQIIIDLGGLIQEEEASFQIEIADEEGGLSYASKTDVGTLTVPVHQLRGTGVYFLSVKDSKGAELWSSDALFIGASNSR